MEVAVSLYKADAPLHIYDAEKLLSFLREEDFVRLVSDSYHNYMGYQEEGTVYELPWEYECSDEKNSFLLWSNIMILFLIPNGSLRNV